jgi:hypothetical protein
MSLYCAIQNNIQKILYYNNVIGASEFPEGVPGILSINPRNILKN